VPLSPHGRRWLQLLLAVGALVQLLIAVLTVHKSYDLTSFRIVEAALRSHPGDVYTTGRWPYPPGFFPFVAAAGGVHRWIGIDLSILIKLPTIASELALAWVVQAFLGIRGASERARLAAAALVVLGPSFVANSAYEGQIDVVTTLPGAAALYVWSAWPPGRRRNTLVGLLIGLGAAIKSVPLLLLLAFVPMVRGWGERVRLAVIAFAVPGVLLLPWVVANRSSLRALNYAGLPGAGGLSLTVQPSLADAYLVHGSDVRYSEATLRLMDLGKPVLLVALAALGIYLLVVRVRPAQAAVLVWLTVYAFLPNFFFGYALWGLPIFLMAGYVREVAAVQAVLLVPLVLAEARPWDGHAVAWIYTPIMLLVWAGAVVALVVQVRRAGARDTVTA
jgi:hypothetical protein